VGKVRLDQLLLQRGLVESRSLAQARILAGDVLVEGHPVTKAGAAVPEDAELRLRGEAPAFVSRGGLMLAGALDAFGIDPAGRTCFDAGASTGGFTDCLLQRGAARVYAVDVGTNQLHWKLRSDPRVVSLEQTNLRLWDPSRVPEPCSLLVADLSFISLRLAIPPVLPSLAPGAEAVLLVKPQFEAGPADVGKGGIVRNPAVRRRVCEEVWAFFAGTELRPLGLVPSPIRGGEGNVEFLLRLGLGREAQPFPAGVDFGPEG
jgi:23S rRNA (cytidine1920-2'-O)/16S rRNA (cytidine1409-2'-O)-methyltransferase